MTITRSSFRALCLILVLAALSCSRNDVTKIRVTSPMPSGIVRRDTVLSFTFSRGVAEMDSLNSWTSTPFVEFTPPVPGKFTWQDSTRLIFSPDGAFPGDAKVKGKFNTSLLVSMSKATGFSGPDDFEFATEPFTLRSAELFYERLSESHQVGIKANLIFSYAVDPAEILAHLKITIDDAPLQGILVMAKERSHTIPLELGTVTQSEKQRTIVIRFDKDLVSPETGTRISMESPMTIIMAPLAELRIYGHEAGFDGQTGWIRIQTSQAMDPARIKQFIRLSPDRDFTVSAEGTAFTIHGAFEPGATVQLTIAEGLESDLGGKLKNSYEADVYIGQIPPAFRFASESGVYMLLGGEKKLEILTTNVPKLNVTISQIFQNNLVYFLQNGRNYDYDYEDYDEEGGGWGARKFRYSVANYGRRLSFDTMAIKALTNKEATTLLDLNPFLHTGYRGFYLVEIAASDKPWKTTSKLVSLSDLGMIVKRSADVVQIFVTSLEDARPVKGVTVSLVSANNQTVAAGSTDGDGTIRFTDMVEKTKDFPLYLVTAEKESDFNFLTLGDYQVETSRYDVGGKRDNENVYDALLYGDRNLYRPGEMIILSGVVRNLTEAIPASMPVKLKTVDPRGTAVAEQQLVLNSDGSFEATYPTKSSALTGTYQFELSTGSGQYIAEYSVSVEEFVPDRVRVILTPSTERCQAGETLKYDCSARNFFGPPAAGRSWQFEGSYIPTPYVSKAFPSYRFANDAVKNEVIQPVLEEGKTDQEGKASFSIELPEKPLVNGMLRLRGRIAVFDESGRPVYQVAQTIVDPLPYYLGVMNGGAYYVNPGTPQTMKIVAVDPSDRPIKGFRAKVDIVRFEWHSVLRQHGSDKTLRYVSELREIPVQSNTLVLGDGTGQYTFSVNRSGEYAVRTSKEGESGYNQFSFYSYSWGSTDVTSFAIDPEARVDIVMDKSVYAPGDKAHVLFQTPFSGTMLVTVERRGVMSYQYLDVANNAASMDIPIEDNFLPNVYVSAVLFRKIKELNIPLLAGHGFAPIMVEKKINKLTVAIEAPAKIRPRTKQTVTVNVSGENNVALTLAAVDEGILQMKNYKTPDPYSYFYARKALETETFDFFKHLIQEPSKRSASSSGGSDAELERRVNPLSAQRVKPVALWSGIKHTDGSGKVQVTFDVPDFNGEVRLMVFAYKGDRFGAASQPMTVADPVVVTPALPRFLSPGDSISMAITAHNTTAAPVSLRFDVQTTGGILLAARPAGLEVKANQEAYTLAGLRVGRQLGKATVNVKTATPEGEIESLTELPVRPASPFMSDAIVGSIEGGGTARHDVPDVFFKEGRRAYITISPFPVANFAGRLKNLVGYPYGCIEQITSKAFPQIYLRDIAALLAPSAIANGSPTYFVNEAISILGTMQTPDGGFMYWPGGGGPAYPWATVYATHFLTEARKAGYAVPDGLMKPALNAVAAIARERKTVDYAFYTEGKTTVRRIADKSTIYALYVLAIAGVPDRSIMDFYRGDKALLTGDTRIMLAASYALSAV